MTPGMELVWEKFHPMPDEVRNETLIHFLTMPDNTILFEGKADTSQNNLNDFIFTGLIDLDGNLLDFHFYIDPYYADFGVYSELTFNFDTTAIYIIGDLVKGPYSITTSFIELDMDLNVTSSSQLFDGSLLTSPTSVAWLPNGNLILADRENNYGSETEGLLVKLLDSDLTFIRDTFMVRPGMVYIPICKGLDYTDPDNIWIATFNAMGSPTPDEIFHVQVFDSDMDLKGVKECGGEKKYYRFFNLLATSDGGCLLSGMVPACDTCENNNAYLFKLMPADVVVTGDNDQSYHNTYSVEVFPNPFFESLNVKTNKKGLNLSIYDFMGKEVIGSEISISGLNLNTGCLNKGIYIYRISEQGKIIKNGKLIKY